MGAMLQLVFGSKQNFSKGGGQRPKDELRGRVLLEHSFYIGRDSEHGSKQTTTGGAENVLSAALGF